MLARVYKLSWIARWWYKTHYSFEYTVLGKEMFIKIMTWYFFLKQHFKKVELKYDENLGRFIIEINSGEIFDPKSTIYQFSDLRFFKFINGVIYQIK